MPPSAAIDSPAAPHPTSFCRVAKAYAFLERLMFGRQLERARFCHLPALRDCRDILLLGEGDGRCLARVAQIAPRARLYCVDASPAMLARAAARLTDAERARVRFIRADVRDWCPPPAAYDAVVTVFFLDCLPEADVRALVEKMPPALRPGARWLWADFELPAAGLARWRAQAWLRAMYGFFRHSAELQVRDLPPTREILRAAGWETVARQSFQRVFALSEVLSQPGCSS